MIYPIKYLEILVFHWMPHCSVTSKKKKKKTIGAEKDEVMTGRTIFWRLVKE